MPHPTLTDYTTLFDAYGDRLSTAYMETGQDRYRLLFEQICHMLIQQSRFNQTLPQPFCRTARDYLSGVPEVVAHMSSDEPRNFMLSDLYDYISLQRRAIDRSEQDAAG